MYGCAVLQSVQLLDLFDDALLCRNGRSMEATGRAAPLVSCGQHGDYNELGNILKVKLQPYIDSGKITKQDALNALSECCEEIENPRSREDFYAALTEKLGMTIKK